MEDHFYDSRSLALGGAPELPAIHLNWTLNAQGRKEPPKSTCALIASRCATLDVRAGSLSFFTR
jgi:hypothetical protein